MAIIQSGVDTSVLTVDPISKAARATLYDANGNPISLASGSQPSIVSGVPFLGLNDNMLLPARMDRFGSLATSLHQPLMAESFEGSVTNPMRWNITASTMAATQSTVAGLIMNSGAIVTANTGYMIQSVRKFFMSQRQPQQTKLRGRCIPYANSIVELGWGDATSATIANTTGAFWQYSAAGVFQPVIMYNGAMQTGASVSTLNYANYYTFDVFKDDDQITFTIQDTSTGLIVNKQILYLSSGAQRLFSATQLSIIARVYTTGTAPATAPQLIVTDIYSSLLDGNNNAPIAINQALQQRSLETNPFTGVQLGNFTNSTEPASATLSNTTAGYPNLGGRFQFAAVAGAVTDYALFGFQVPSPSTFVITGIDIETWNTGAAVATTPTVLEWLYAANLTAVSLATTGPRVGIGAQDFQVGAAVGARASRLSKSYISPIVVGPGRWFVIGLRMPVGTATPSQVLAGMVNIEGFPI